MSDARARCREFGGETCKESYLAGVPSGIHAPRCIADLVCDVRSYSGLRGSVSQEKKGTGSPMIATTQLIISCPVCQSHGAMLHHDIRAPLVYSCQNCMHEWQIDPAEEPPQADPTVAERPRTPWARSRPPRKR